MEGISWTTEGKQIARYRSRSAKFDEGNFTLYYSWEGEHARESTLPRYFGVGEMTFRKSEDSISSRAEGWFSSSDSSDVQSTITKSTVFVRATPEELVVINGTNHDQRDELIEAKLSERKRF